MEKYKLSELNDQIEVSIEDSSKVYTVAELKREIVERGENHHKSKDWYTVKRQIWEPSAERMIENYLDNESGDLYEDFYSAAMSEMSKGAIEKIQTILDNAFKNKSVSVYWVYENPVEIDILP